MELKSLFKDSRSIIQYSKIFKEGFSNRGMVIPKMLPNIKAFLKKSAFNQMKIIDEEYSFNPIESKELLNQFYHRLSVSDKTLRSIEIPKHDKEWFYPKDLYDIQIENLRILDETINDWIYNLSENFPDLKNIYYPFHEELTTTNNRIITPFGNDFTEDVFYYLQDKWNNKNDIKHSYIWEFLNDKRECKLGYKNEFEKFIRVKYNFTGKFQYHATNSEKAYNKLKMFYEEFNSI